jgi:hypothetical protein
MVSSSSLISSHVFSLVAKLIGEFTSLEEPNIVIVAVLLADGSDFVESERQIEPKNPTRKFRLPIVRSIS